MDNIFINSFTITPEYLRHQIEQAHCKAIKEALWTIQKECLKAAEEQSWGVCINMYKFNIDPEDITNILKFLETLGFKVDKPDDILPSTINPSYDVYITWDDEYVSY